MNAAAAAGNGYRWMDFFPSLVHSYIMQYEISPG
jgi:hypothetical protein